MWQDIGLMIFNIMFVAVLYRQICHMRRTGESMDSIACGTTSAGLVGCAVMYATLNLPLSTLVSIASAIVWGVLFFMTLKNGKKHT